MFLATSISLSVWLESAVFCEAGSHEGRGACAAAMVPSCLGLEFGWKRKAVHFFGCLSSFRVVDISIYCNVLLSLDQCGEL